MDNRLPQPETLPHTRLHERRHRRNPTRETPTPVKYISLFSGIEAATVAWQPLGWEPIAYAEVEPFPKAVLKQHYPNVPDLGDMTKVDWKQYHHAADVVVGGSPCQAFSIAGLRKALDDPRGQLMLEYLRACAEIDPEWIVWENVPGVLSAEHGRAFQSLLEAAQVDRRRRGGDVPQKNNTAIGHDLVQGFPFVRRNHQKQEESWPSLDYKKICHVCSMTISTARQPL